MAEKKLKAVLFDMDGTIMDSMPWHDKSWKEFLQRKNLDFTPQLWAALHHGTLVDIMPRIFGESISLEDIWRLGMEKEAIFKELYRGNTEPLAGVKEFLLELRAAGIKTALATAADRSNANFALDELDFHRLFDVVVSSNEVPVGKPEPDVYLFAAHCLKSDPENCVVFEDSSSGIESGRRAGMKVIGVQTTIKDMSLLPVEKAIQDYTAISLKELNHIFDAR